MTRERNDRTLRETAWAQIARMKATWPAHRWTDDYLAELGRCLMAGADQPTDIIEAVTAAIAEHDDRYPPPIAAMTQRVSRRRIHRIEAERDAEREATRRRETPQPQEPWRGWLALAATHAMLADRGHPTTPTPSLQPFVDLVTDLGYRNHHGCGPWRDPEGRLHAEDPDYDKTLTATALHGAEQIWRAHGMPAAPTPASLVGKPLEAAA